MKPFSFSEIDESEEENIRNIIKKEEIVEKEVFNYKSKYSEKVRRDVSATKKQHQSMGYAEVPLKSSNEYLKKNDRIDVRAYVDHNCLGRHSPRQTHPGNRDKECYFEQNKKNKKINFIKENAINIKNMRLPSKIEKKIIDSHHGHTQRDMQPVHIFTKKFGKCPKYIIERKKEKLNREDSSPKQVKRSPFQQIGKEERLNILKGLKNYWSELQKEFQELPLKIDTEPQKKRKSMLEKKLKELEKDIDLIEKHEIIYIRNNEY